MNESLTSAQVVLNQPSRSIYEAAQDFFEQAGFTVGPLIANNFSISAPVTTFDSYFHTSPDVASKRGLQDTDLNLDVLPPDIRLNVDAILLSRPPDFGPFNP